MHLYIHVPFCARRCSYCDFAIAVRREVPSRRYVAALLSQWRRRRVEWSASDSIATLYLGGGTPSHLAPDALADLIAGITADMPLADGAEVTLEANPDDVTPEAALAWCSAGVNRVSLGVQSHDPRVLEWMHRTHSADQVPEAVATLRQAGVANLSLDLIFALPSALERDWRRDLDLTLALEPEHVSLYGLTVEPATPLGRWTARGEVVPGSDASYAAEYLLAHRRLRDAGYDHYEVSNAARPGHQAVHNRSYWRHADCLGLGPGAHSHRAGRRSWNIREWAAWEQAIVGGEDGTAGVEDLSPAEWRTEELYLGLRTREGLAADRLPRAAVDAWQEQGWAVLIDDRICLTVDGWLRLDALVAGVMGS